MNPEVLIADDSGNDRQTVYRDAIDVAAVDLPCEHRLTAAGFGFASHEAAAHENFGRSRFDRTYRPYLPGVLKARADQLVLEFAGRELSELDVWKEYGGDRELGAGVIDVKGFYPETPEDVARRIKRVLTVCKPEKLTVNPDCGFGWSPRYMCNQKVRALAAGAVLARQELTGKK